MLLFPEIYEELPLVSLPKKPDSESTTLSIKSEDMEAGDEKKKDSTQDNSKLMNPSNVQSLI